jgi:hypothetical protein
LNIKTTYLIPLFLLLISCKTSLQEKVTKGNFNFTISLGSCFENDEVSIELNGINIIRNEIITSNRILGSTGYYFSYYKYKNDGKLIIQANDKKKEIDNYLNNKNYEVTVTINGFKNYFLLDLSKGNNIMIEKCTENRHLGIAGINYYRGIIYLE